MRRIFIGDVQGCLEPLERLLAAVGFDVSKDRVYLCGDLVNKGPDNAAVLRRVRSIGAESVLGNHDVEAVELVRGRIATWPGHTLDDLLRAPDREELVGWLESRPLAIDLKDVFLVHAAVRPTWGDLSAVPTMLRERYAAAVAAGRSPYQDDELRFAVTARFTDPFGRQPAVDWPPPGPPYENWIDTYRDSRTVVFGHFARQGLVIRDRIRGLDTGCVYGKELTAWIAEEDRIVSVPGTSK
jgi:bis(5'-nucleosyl)-tetraphosphatase (symmetrical)